MYNEGMLKENSLENKSFIVTGGGSGLGKSMSSYLLSLGANVIIVSRDEQKLKKATDGLKINCNSNNQIIYQVCDVKDSSMIENVIDNSFSEFNHIDGIINNAAGNFISPTEKLSPNAFSAIIDIVLKGTCTFSLLYGKKCIDTKLKGKIVNIITTYAFTGSAYVVPSAAAKGGVLSLTRSLAAEWSKYNIYSNAIAPGPFPTEGAWSRLFPKPFSMLFDMEKKHPLRRYGDHQELANLSAYLLSDYSDYINGEIITIDGAEWIHNAGQFNKLDKVPKKLWTAIKKITKR
ncbi:MAG: short-chain dehydrogenase [Candidatus Marinimicrobia bacterium]|nr:short-chain dehydrogenase [Candidatus Neomarinimicrobiota bacterium]